MSALPTDDCFVFVIKTDCYAGNFERQMCGYLTGVVGDCGVGGQQQGEFDRVYPNRRDFEEIIGSFPDDHGCHRPATIWGDESEDVGILFDEKPSPTQLDLMMDRAMEFAKMTDPCDGIKKHITIQGFTLYRYEVVHTKRIIGNWGVE